MLGDLTGSTSVGKKEDPYVAKNEKASELWRPGANFKPTYFNEAKGPKVGPTSDILRSFTVDGAPHVSAEQIRIIIPFKHI